jgi:protoporphyrinogen IX oxidase
MITLQTFVPHLKALHLVFLCIWVAGLYALPRMLARHDRAIAQEEFTQIRRATHFGYVWVISPAAILAIASGSALVFLREVFTGWAFAKFVLVALLVGVHAWIGHTIIAVAETEGQHEPPEPLIPTLVISGLVVSILCLVLAKPELDELAFPAWLMQPLGRQLPFDAPNR